MVSHCRRTEAAASTESHLGSTDAQAHTPSRSIMKAPVAALAVLLCAMALCSQVFSAPFGADTPTACCFSYVARQLSRKIVADYFETSSQCSKPGVIFQTRTSSLQLPGHSGIQLQVDDVFLDPVLTGVGTDLPASFRLEAVESSRRVTHCPGHPEKEEKTAHIQEGDKQK
uniref:Chemokine interleukin-8-like domain-containing protein n=1 Tax=Bos indicus x Bos taurus TaxID=30522 RepID=A0A4W2BQT6_BOBOX